MKKVLKKEQEKAKILSKALYGKVRLEHHPTQGFRVTFWVVSIPFFITWDMFDKIHEKFAEIVKIKTAKKDAKE